MKKNYIHPGIKIKQIDRLMADPMISTSNTSANGNPQAKSGGFQWGDEDFSYNGDN